MTDEERLAQDGRPLCITLPDDSVVIRGRDFDSMNAEIRRLSAQLANADPAVRDDRASAWEAVWKRLLEIDPNMCGRTSSGLTDALSLINELAARPKS
jgi:hypothetical protein